MNWNEIEDLALQKLAQSIEGGQIDPSSLCHIADIAHGKAKLRDHYTHRNAGLNSPGSEVEKGLYGSAPCSSR